MCSLNASRQLRTTSSLLSPGPSNFSDLDHLTQLEVGGILSVETAPTLRRSSLSSLFILLTTSLNGPTSLHATIKQ